MVESSVAEPAQAVRYRGDRRHVDGPADSPQARETCRTGRTICCDNRHMDVNTLKGRVAEALVESIFRRALYRVARVGRESQVHGLVKMGSGEFSPDFMVWKHVEGQGAEPNLHRLFAVEIKYRSNLRDFVRKDWGPLAAKVREQWPNLYCVLVTDNPEAGRSCFQVFSVRDHADDAEPAPVDLHNVADLDIFKTTVQEYEGLVHEIFSLLSAYGRDD